MMRQTNLAKLVDADTAANENYGLNIIATKKHRKQKTSNATIN